MGDFLLAKMWRGGAKEWGKRADMELRGKKVGAKALILEQGAKEKGKNADF